jgi:hypothetical protein
LERKNRNDNSPVKEGEKRYQESYNVKGWDPILIFDQETGERREMTIWKL